MTHDHDTSVRREPTSVEERASKVRLRRALTLAGMTLVLPGSAQLVAGNRKVGLFAIKVALTLLVTVVVLGVLTWFNPGFALWAGTRTWLLLVLRFVLIALAVGWAYLVVDAWRLGRPGSLRAKQVAVTTFTNVAVGATVLSVLLFSAHLVGVQRDLIVSLSGSGTAQEASEGRHNILLAGGDSGAGRMGLRPDSLTVASIDLATGRTVLIGLPRNMANFPFPEDSVMAEHFPEGFNCDDCMLNGVSTWVTDHPELFKGADNPGMEGTVEAVEGITGLEISYWVLVNMRGFEKLVDAFGGVELNVRDTIPVGLPGVDSWYREIEPGVKVLDGEDTLWFARARHGSDDYSRMARQKCVMGAMLNQISPQSAVTKIGDIAEASSSMLSTSIPSGEFNVFAALALKAKDQKMASVSLVPPLINTGNPDMDVVWAEVAKAIEKSENPGKFKKARKKAAEGEQGTATAEPTPAAEPTVTGGSKGSMKHGYEANQSDDVAASC